MPFKYNPFTDELDVVGLTQGAADTRYVNVSGDTMTGALNANGGIADSAQNTFGAISASLSNLLTNPSFETNVTTGTATTGYDLTAGATLTRSTAVFATEPGGVASCKVDTTGSGQGISVLITNWDGVSKYFVSFYIRGAIGGETVDYAVRFAGGGFVQSGSSGTATLTTSFQRINLIVTSANANSFGIVIRSTGGTETFYVDGLVACISGLAVPYFDGSTTGYSWGGTANISTSNAISSFGGRMAFTGLPISLGGVSGTASAQGTLTGDKILLFLDTYGFGIGGGTLQAFAPTNAQFNFFNRTTSVSRFLVQANGGVSINYSAAPPVGTLFLIPNDASTVGEVIRGNTSQSADLLQLQNSAGTILTAFQSDGKLVFGPSGSQDTNLYRSAADTLATDDDLSLKTAGKGIQIKEGSNARMGTATLVGGTVTVSNTSVTANTRIFLTVQSLGTVTLPTAIAITARTAATSFTITSADATDTSVIAWQLIEPSA